MWFWQSSLLDMTSILTTSITMGGAQSILNSKSCWSSGCCSSSSSSSIILVGLLHLISSPHPQTTVSPHSATAQQADQQQKTTRSLADQQQPTSSKTTRPQPSHSHPPAKKQQVPQQNHWHWHLSLVTIIIHHSFTHDHQHSIILLIIVLSIIRNQHSAASLSSSLTLLRSTQHHCHQHKILVNRQPLDSPSFSFCFLVPGLDVLIILLLHPATAPQNLKIRCYRPESTLLILFLPHQYYHYHYQGQQSTIHSQRSYWYWSS